MAFAALITVHWELTRVIGKTSVMGLFTEMMDEWSEQANRITRLERAIIDAVNRLDNYDGQPLMGFCDEIAESLRYALTPDK